MSNRTSSDTRREFMRRFEALPLEEKKQQVMVALKWLVNRLQTSEQDRIDEIAADLLADVDI